MPQLPDLALVTVNNDYLLARFRQALRQCRPKTAKSNHTERGMLHILHSYLLNL